MRESHSNLSGKVILVRKFTGDGVKVGPYESDRAARACARMHAVLNIHSRIFFAFVFFRGHEFDAHFLGTVWDWFLKLKNADS